MSWIRTPSARKKRRLRRQVRKIRAWWPRSVLLAEDETDLLLFPPLRACWSLRGQPAKVRLCGRNARRVIFGAMNLGTGHRLFLPQKHQRADDFQEFLHLIHDSYRGWHVALLLDEDPSHTAEDSLTLAWSYDIDLLWLPKRCPELNPMDTLWGQAKDCRSANKQYASIDDQVDRFLDYLQSWSGREALHTAGVLSQDFWLKHALSKNFCGLA
jgi:DDE superfamily endonuclease